MQVSFARLRIRDVARWLAFLFALALFARLLLGAEGAGALSLLRQRGPVLLVGLVPFFVFEVIDTAAWRRLIQPLGYAPRFLSLLRARLSAEAVNLTLPAGAAVSEAVTPSLLFRVGGIAIGDGVVALAARRWTVLRAHSAYLALAALAGAATLSNGRPSIPWLLLFFAGVALAVSVGLQRLFEEKSGSTRVESLLERLPGRLHRSFAKRRAAFVAVDRRFELFARAEKARWPAVTAIYLCAWMVEAAETLLLLRLLGARISFLQVFPIEAALSFVRSVAFVAPAGLGIQDLGYVTLLEGTPRPVVLAFVALKRGKELFWAAIGYLAMLQAGKAQLAVAPEVST